ncbi:MAG TPA: hypothetical protein PLV55_13615 [Anaerohalosphaeraceae bacterium]|nr:hypothetical protein [Anaerohalosphaeraceae bacterium]HOL90113.1 hypothetical protein [Anaerohalosphaeraceae bacterium]
MRIRKRNCLLLMGGALLVFFLAKIGWLFAQRPLIQTDYVAEYNDWSKPPGFKPDENAAFLYQKAFEAYVPKSDEVWAVDPFCLRPLPGSMIEWLKANTAAAEYFQTASDKPYYRPERFSEDGSMGGIRVPELPSFKQLAEVCIWKARLEAQEGRFEKALETLLHCWRAGNHLCSPQLFVADQFLGLRLRQMAAENLFLLLRQYSVSSSILRLWQESLEKLAAEDMHRPSFKTEKFFAEDMLQRTFLDNGRGTGRWAWRSGYPRALLASDLSAFHIYFESLKERTYFCLFGPTRNEIARQIDDLINLSDHLLQKTPWQIHQDVPSVFERFDEVERSHIFFIVSQIHLNPEAMIHTYHKTAAQMNALIAVLAVLRYKNDTGVYPKTLDKLTAEGYLRSVPMDPYSGSPMIYKVLEDGFTLYSIGEDFEDNGGTFNKETPKRDISLHIHFPDIVYWPIAVIAAAEKVPMMGQL